MNLFSCLYKFSSQSSFELQLSLQIKRLINLLDDEDGRKSIDYLSKSMKIINFQYTTLTI